MAGDPELLRLLLWELCDSVAEGWSTTSAEDLPMELGGHNVWVLSFYPLSRNDAQALDEAARRRAGYFGALELDLGSALHRDLLWESLIYNLYYDRGSLLHVQGWDLGEERYNLNQGGEWWESLGFGHVGWHEDRVDRSPEPADPPLHPVSPRGRLTAERLASRKRPTHLLRVIEGLREESSERSAPLTFSAVLPDASHVLINPDKLTGYVLSPSHEDGKNKAHLFKELLGIVSSDWRFLDAQLRRGLLDAPAHRVCTDSWGVKYHVDLAVVGRNDVVKAVRTAWIVETGAYPRLTTAYLAPTDVDLATLPTPWKPPVMDLTPVNDEGWRKLFDLADGLARESAAKIVPTPMFVQGRGYPEGLIGGAIITLRDARRGFARWLIATGRATRDYRGGAEFASECPGQSADRAAAYADTFALVLRLNGVDCAVRRYLD